jgi:hypothetical protein
MPNIFIILGIWYLICSGPDWYGVPGIPLYNLVMQKLTLLLAARD